MATGRENLLELFHHFYFSLRFVCPSPVRAKRTYRMAAVPTGVTLTLVAQAKREAVIRYTDFRPKDPSAGPSSHQTTSATLSRKGNYGFLHTKMG